MMTPDLIFTLGLSLLLTHELDAVRRHEWRIFPLLSRMSDRSGYTVYILGHIPLFLLVFWFVAHPSPGARQGFQFFADLFMVAHLGLHFNFQSHEQYEFTSALSRWLIRSTALMGAVHGIYLMMFASMLA